MRKIGIFLGLFLLVSLFSAGICVSSSTEEKKKKEPGVYNGWVAELDLKANRMVVAMKKKDLAMLINTSRAKAGLGYKDLGEVKIGDEVEVKYEVKVGVTYALTVSRDQGEGTK